MIEKVSDERLDVLVQQRAHDEEWYLTELQTFYLLRELQEWRSGKRKRWQDEVTCTISADLSGLDAALASAAAALGRAAEREQAATRADHDVDRFYLENTDYRIEDIVALDDTGYNWNLIHGIGLCGTTRTPFEGWRCILSAGGLSMAGYEGTTMHEAISAALSALDQGREAEAQPAPVVPEKPTWEEAVKRMAAEREQTAPEPRKPAKWERQLREMGGVVEYNRDTGQYEATGEGVKWYCADTAKAAIAAAWRAWKEEQGE
jgi:hypothetical protein